MKPTPFRSVSLLAILLVIPFGFLVYGPAPGEEPQSLTVSVIAEYPHDPTAYTQGLLFSGSRMFEGTGLYGESTLRETVLETGVVLRSVDLPANRFGEGLAQVGDHLIQLTWKSGDAIVYDLETFAIVEHYGYSGEGWGLCYDGQRLIMSDGTSRLTFRSTTSFDVVSSVTVTLDGTPVPRLNELEYVDGFVYANVYTQNDIMKINPATGKVVAVIDASSLVPESARPYLGEVLNGIAYHPVNKTFFLTGKRWPVLYEVLFVPKTP